MGKRQLFTVVPLIGTTAANGTATVVAPFAVNGMLYAIHEDKGSLDDGVDFTLSIVRSEMVQTVLTLANANTDNTIWAPRIDSVSQAGAALSQNNIPIPVVGVFSLAIAQGGNVKRGGLYAFVIE